MLITLAAMLFAAPGLARGNESEIRLKSAYIVKFAQYIDWPDGYLKAGGPFRILVLGNPAMFEEMKNAAGQRQIQGHTVEVSASILDTPAIVISDGKSAEWNEVQKKFLGQPVLLVNAAEKTPAPFTIQFFLQDARLRFEISQSSAKTQNLKISSQLMKLAVVKD